MADEIRHASLKVLLVSEDVPSPRTGGLARHALTLARALARAGHRVDFLGNNQYPIEAAGAEGQFGGRFFGELGGHAAGWKERSLGVFLPPKRPWQARALARCIMRHAGEYDVVHYHGHFPNIARYIPLHVNFVQTRHDHGSDCLVQTRFRDGGVCSRTAPADCAECIAERPGALRRRMSAAAVRRFRADVAEAFRRHKTVFVSEMLRRSFSRTAGPGPWGTVVHNFVDAESLRRAGETARSFPASGKREVFVAAILCEYKGVESFLRTLLPRMPADMRVIIAGDGPEERHLRAEFEGQSVRFLGWSEPEDTRRQAARADMVVVPSIVEEACATTVLEGLLLGKPTFALDRGGTPELLAYAQGTDQLRLHKDMESLARDLVAYRPDGTIPRVPNRGGDVDRALPRLLDIYRAPPGAMEGRE